MPPRLSIIVPAYNEARRLPRFLDSLRRYVQGRDDYEIIVVDDGSQDEQHDLVAARQKTWPQLQMVRHEINRGKGAAVRTGMLTARGARWLFADADGATPIDQEQRLQAAIDAGADVACGSRLVRLAGTQQKRNFFRGLAGKCYAAIARQILPVGVRDTQCGFKLFTAEAGREIFSAACENGFAFDVELLALAHRLNLRIDEVPIEWHEQPGSKVSPLRDGARMLRQLWRIRRRLATVPPVEIPQPSHTMVEPPSRAA
jgi:dolichyl-phosphate beta-glucosyltransferase